MKKNMGAADRLIRIGAAITMIILYATGQIEGMMGIVLIVLAGVFLLTSFVSFCPLYLPLGLSTLRKKISRKTN